MRAERFARIAAAALAVSGCAGAGPRALAPHVEWPISDDAGWATVPALGVTLFADERVAELRGGYRPELHLRWLGFAREGVERTGDGDFDRPVDEAVRAELVATLQRAGTFASVTPVSFDPRDPEAWPRAGAPPLVLTGALEVFEGRQWRSVTVSPLQIGFVRERWGPADGRVSLRIELWSKSQRVFDARIATHRDVAQGGAADAAVQALALAAERLALRLDARLREQRAQPPRMLDVLLLDGCELGDARAHRLIAETSAIFEREAGIVLAARRQPWTERPRRADLDELLAAAERVSPPAGGVVLALAPAQEVSELALRSVRTGLAAPLGAHAVSLCAGEDEASVLTAAHELAHLFGAVHVRDPASIMHATADFDARFFDPLNRRILRSTRSRDFARALDPDETARLAAIYRAAQEATEGVDRETVDGALRALEGAEP
ncbi:MAG: hypothetical protein ACHQ6T_08365 [Myxococcota bacterium]